MSTETNTCLRVPERDNPHSSARLAVFLSCAVCPGAGHFVQRRWVLGALYLAAFVICLVMMILAVVVPLMMNLHIALDLAEKGSSGIFRTISLVKVLTWFGLTALVYFAALVDIIAYARRQARRRVDERRKNLEEKQED